METYDAVQRAARATVVDLRPTIRRKEWQAKNRWAVTKDVLDRIAADIWPDLADAPEVGTVKGKAPKRPPLTYDAERTLREITTKLVSIPIALEALSERALKGLAFEARQHAKLGETGPLWAAVAEVADRHGEIEARRRTGRRWGRATADEPAPGLGTSWR